MDIHCRVTTVGLVPLYDSDWNEKRKLREGDTVLCHITKPRNYEFHKKFFALIRLTFDNLPERLAQMLAIRSEEDMLDCLKIDLGMFHSVWHGGRQVVRLDSISFAAMDNTDFEKFYNRSLSMILNKYLSGTSEEEIKEVIQQYF